MPRATCSRQPTARSWNGVLATTTGGMRTVEEVDDETGEIIEIADASQLGLYHFANLPTAYVSEDDQYYLAAYRIEVADVEHTENADGTDNQWLLTRYHTENDAAGAALNRTLDSDASDVVETGVAGGIKLTGSYEENGQKTRTNAGQVILAGTRPASSLASAGITSETKPVVVLERKTAECLLDTKLPFGSASAQLTALPENLAARCGLLPFHAVGTDGGLLLYFRPDSVLRADGTALDCVCAVSAVSIGQGAYEGLIGV